MFALAQGSGGASVTGVVKDSSGAVLPGVTVEASSPALIEKVRSAVTDASGNYRIIELRPGTYTVTYTLPGFTTLRREGIELSTNFTATLNIDMKVGAVAETVTVTGETPLIDVKGVTREQVISKAMMDALPTSKSMGGLIALVPGAVSPANGLDVGGSKGEQSVRISVHGARTGDMRQMVDGMLFSNLNSDGAGRLYFVNPITVQENVIDLGTAGSAQYQLGGAVINSIPRDGGNRFTATAFVAGTGHNLQSNNLTDELRAQQITQVNGVRDIYDFSGLVGGPAVRDRLWWVVSARLNGSTTRSANQFHDANLDDWKFTPDPNQPVDPEEKTRSNQFRMTWQASKKDKITGFYDIQKHFRQQAFGELDRGEAVIESGAAMCHNDSLTQFTWARPQSQKLLFEGGGTVGLNTFGRPSFGTQLDGSDYQRCGISEPLRVLVIDAPAGYTAGYHGFGSVGIGIANQFAGRASASVVTGSHTFKVGMNILKGYIKGNTYRNPLDVQGLPLQYAFTNGVPSAFTEFTSQYTEVDLDHDLGLFAQDQWSLGRLTVNAGLRFDWITAHDPTIVEPANALFPSFTAPGVDNVPNWKDLSPRVGVAWDVMGDGKTVVKGGVNRYVTTLTTSVASLFGPAANFSTARNWTDTNKNFFPDCDMKNAAANGECGAFLNPSVGTFGPATAKPDPEWVTGWGKRGYNWQTSISVDRQIGSRAAMNVGYYRTIYGNFYHHRQPEPGAERLRSVLRHGARRCAAAEFGSAGVRALQRAHHAGDEQLHDVLPELRQQVSVVGLYAVARDGTLQRRGCRLQRAVRPGRHARRRLERGQRGPAGLGLGGGRRRELEHDPLLHRRQSAAARDQPEQHRGRELVAGGVVQHADAVSEPVPAELVVHAAVGRRHDRGRLSGFAGRQLPGEPDVLERPDQRAADGQADQPGDRPAPQPDHGGRRHHRGPPVAAHELRSAHPPARPARQQDVQVGRQPPPAGERRSLQPVQPEHGHVPARGVHHADRRRPQRRGCNQPRSWMAGW